jgi:quercetin dioxygenase-like cupin family protein
MKRLGPLLCILLAVFSVALPGATASAQVPPGPSVAHQAKFPATTPAGPFEVVQVIAEFAPGAWTPPHTHGGEVFVSVLEGEVTFRSMGSEQNFKVGETWTEQPGHFAAAGNAGTAKARLLATFVLPKGAQLTTNQEGISTQQLPPGPTTVYMSRGDAAMPSGPFEIVQLVLDFAASTWTPPHTHGGQGFVLVTEGEMTLRMMGMDHKYKAGESWVDIPDIVHAAGNDTPAKASLVASFVLPVGAALTTVQAPAAAPAPAAPAPAPAPAVSAAAPPPAAVPAAPVAAPAAQPAPAQMPRALPRTGQAADVGLLLAAGGVLVGAGWLMRLWGCGRLARASRRSAHCRGAPACAPRGQTHRSAPTGFRFHIMPPTLRSDP